MSRLHKVRPVANVIRKIWIVLTFLLMALPVILGGLVGIFVGIVNGIRFHSRFVYELRSGVLNGAIRVAQVLLPWSSRVYTFLFAHNLYHRYPLPRPTKEFLIVGHRGSPSKQCENTIPSYQAALDDGANALEIDLCLTQDGEVVVWHDWDPNSLVSVFREGGLEAFQRFRPDFGEPEFRRCSSALNLEQLRANFTLVPQDGSRPDPNSRPHILSFREFLEWAVTQKGIRAVFLDIKIPPYELHCVEPFLRVVQRDLFEVCPSFDCPVMTIYPQVQAKMKAFAPELTYCFDVELTNALMGSDDASIAASSTVRHAEHMHNKYCSVGRPTFLLLAPWDIYRAVVSHDLEYRQAHNIDSRFITWTINDPNEQKWLADAGVDGILTDLPRQLARQVLRRKTRHLMGSPFQMIRQKI